MSALQPLGGSTRNPLFIPELVHMIIRNSSGYSDARNLAVTCRALFQFIMPRLWRTVVGVEQLLRLIPGTVVEREHMGKSKRTIITISKRALDESWERYWVYSAYVMTLHMLAPEDVPHVHGWNILFAKRKEFGSLLLPNLECLDIEQSHMVLDPIHQLAFFALFLSPSIRKLRFRYYFTHTPTSNDPSLGAEFFSPSALLLVNSLAKTLPASYSITLPPCYDCPTERMIALSDLSIYEGCVGWFERLPVLTNLTCLFIHDGAVSGGSGEGLIVLGHLPQLEYLEILGVFNSNPHPHSLFLGEPLPVPSGLFPRLQTLRFRSIPSTQLFYHIWNSDTMVSKLTEVFIYFDLGHCSVTWNELKSQIIPLMANKSPKLRFAGFLIYIKPVGPDDALVSELEMLPIILSRLSISALTLFGRSVKPYLPHPQIFPHLKYLDVLYPLYRSELRALAASLPNLRHISILLHSETFEHPEADVSEPCKPASLQPILVHVLYDHRLFFDSGSNYLEDNRPQITRFIKSIWPNLSYLGIGDRKCPHNYREFL